MHFGKIRKFYETYKREIMLAYLAIAVFGVTGQFCFVGYMSLETHYGHEFYNVVRYRPDLPRPPKKMSYSYWRTGPIEVAKVFGRSNGCRDADKDLIDLIVRESIRFRLDPRLTASVIVQESQCDTLAVSLKSAIGLMQVVPKIHDREFDFSRVNLFNPEQNVQTGLAILSSLIQESGEVEGLRRYQGVGVGGVVNYPEQILARRANVQR